MKRELASQYEIALTMLKGVVEETDEDIWLHTDEVKEAAGHIAYHVVYYTNIYCSPSEEAVKRWEKQSNEGHVLGPTPWPPHERFVPTQSYTKADIIEFIDFVLGVIPGYLEHLEPEEPCWPHWYKLNQFEFHLNNLRHIQHHMAQLIERNGGSSVGWIGVG
jgi:hypothetical protein